MQFVETQQLGQVLEVLVADAIHKLICARGRNPVDDVVADFGVLAEKWAEGCVRVRLQGRPPPATETLTGRRARSRQRLSCCRGPGKLRLLSHSSANRRPPGGSCCQSTSCNTKRTPMSLSAKIISHFAPNSPLPIVYVERGHFYDDTVLPRLAGLDSLSITYPGNWVSWSSPGGRNGMNFVLGTL